MDLSCCTALVAVLLLIVIAIFAGWLKVRGLVRRWKTVKGNLPGAKVVSEIGYGSYLPPAISTETEFDPRMAAFALRACISSANRRLGGDMQLPPGVQEVAWVGNRALVLKTLAAKLPPRVAELRGSDRPNVYTVAISGTLSYEDLRADLQYRQVDFIGTKAHSGFVDTWKQVFPGIRKVVAADPKAHFLVSGHSLGGAVATLTAIAIGANFPHARCRLYASATPRIGPEEIIRVLHHTAPGSWHTVNRSDIVPTLPPAVALVGVGRAEKNTNALYANFRRVAFFDQQAGDLAGNHLPTTYLAALDKEVSRVGAHYETPVVMPVEFG